MKLSDPLVLSLNNAELRRVRYHIQGLNYRIRDRVAFRNELNFVADVSKFYQSVLDFKDMFSAYRSWLSVLIRGRTHFYQKIKKKTK